MDHPQLGKYIPDYLHTIDNNPMYRDSKSAQLMKEMAADGSAWILNNMARDFIMETNVPSDALQGWRLPYDVMNIEWTATWSGAQESIASVGAVERIIMLVDTDSITTDASDHIKDGFLLFSIFHIDTATAIKHDLITGWVYSGASMFIPYAAMDDLSDWMDTSDDGEDLSVRSATSVDELKTKPAFLPSLDIHSGETWSEWEKSNVKDAMVSELVEELFIAIGMLCLLRCDNIPVDTITPSPLKQRRQKQQKKPPIPTYRTLHVTGNMLIPKGSHNGGAHGEKRAHWRRGHIRNQKTALGHVLRWIAPQIIRADKLLGDLDKPKTVIT